MVVWFSTTGSQLILVILHKYMWLDSKYRTCYLHQQIHLLMIFFVNITLSKDLLNEMSVVQHNLTNILIGQAGRAMETTLLQLS